MCGIAGLYDQTGNPVDPALLHAMTASLCHRGPDGEGFFVDGGTGLGHRRLSIIDVGGGAQPISNEDGTLQVVFNGEIYNYVELREELIALGHVFKTKSDTEVLVHGYEQWGAELVMRLNGMFAFAIADRRSDSLFLARDHLGIKPLYYTTIGTQIVFASEIRTLMLHPGFKREVDPRSLADLFTFRYVPAPRTLMQGVYKLPPGHLLRATRRDVSVQRFWTRLPTANASATTECLVAQYQNLLEDTVRLQMRSDVPVGLFLSSGIDSGVLLSLMSRHTQGPVHAFTVDFADGEQTNESMDAARIAARHGAVHHCVSVSAQDYMSYYERFMDDLEEPVGHEAAPAFYFVSRLARQHVKVALCGQGADEPWAGYHRYLGVKMSELYSRLPLSMTRALGRLATRLPVPVERLKRGALSLGERDIVQRFVSIYSFFSSDMKERLYNEAFKAQIAGHSSAEAIRALQRDVDHLDPLTQMLYIDTRTNLPDDLLMVGDKTSMANSIEVRVPFLDVRLVEFIESLPPQLKLRGLTGKYLHKRALLRWLPHEEVYRKKKGFSNPLGKWLRTTMRPLVDECLLSSNSRVSRYFAPAEIRRIVEADRRGQAHHTRHINLLLSFELWHRAFMS